MTFDDITGDRKLWAVHFEGEDDNELYKVFNNWADVVWLRAFFKENIDDLNAYYKKLSAIRLKIVNAFDTS